MVSDHEVPAEVEWAQSILGNWRACHGYPINTFQATLRTKLGRWGMDAIVGQRLKRTPSILSKLRRYESMRLSQMQDIGGLRAVVKSLVAVRRLEQDYRNSQFDHKLVSDKDYIVQPKDDGYRSVHLVFSYQSARAPSYNGLHIELQVRTRLQHAWATAVETMGTFLGQALKSRQGEGRWLKFFQVVSAAFAHLENTQLVPGYERLSRYGTFDAVADAEGELHVLDKLKGFNVAVEAIAENRQSASYHLVVLDSTERRVQLTSFARTALEQANAAYTEVESRIRQGASLEAVLVSAGSIQSLRRAYPNYFLDSSAFIRKVEQVIREARSERAIARRPRPRQLELF